MADTSLSSTQEPNSFRPDNPTPQSEPAPNQNPDPSAAEATPSAANQSSVTPPLVAPSLPIPAAPSFRPPTMPAFSPLPPNPGFENPNMQIPGQQMGVTNAPSMPMMPMMHSYQVPPPGSQVPNPSYRPFVPMPNGYQPPHQPLPGVPRYLPPYMGMVRPAYPSRPGMLPLPSRPPVPGVPGVPGVRPMVLPIIRPAFVPITPAEKPQTTVYVGKISQTVENEFMLCLLRLCGPVKSWKRAQDPSDGTPKGFGFCEFESAEGVLRALRLLTKLSVDGQELVLNVNQATREYLVRYVEKKTENSKKSAEAKSEAESTGGEQKTAPVHIESETKTTEDAEKNGKVSGEKEGQDMLLFGSVTDEDRDADKEAVEKLKSMMEERLKNNPLPPPPALPTIDVSRSSTEPPNKSKDGDADVDAEKNGTAEDKSDSTSRSKLTTEHDKSEAGSPDRNRRYDKNRDKDKERNVKSEKEKELERLEKDAQRERERTQRERERKIQEAEREYKETLKEWESRERERERQRQYEKDKEKERERKRKKEIKDDEFNDDDLNKRIRRSVLEDKRRKMRREKEDDLADRQKEDEEISEAQKRAEEENLRQQEEDASKLISNHAINSVESSDTAQDSNSESKDKPAEQASVGASTDLNYMGDRILQNGSSDTNIPSSETAHGGSGPTRKLGFGLVGSGKRTAVPSVFNEEHDDDGHSDKKMRPLIPIDYSTEEMQAVQPSSTGGAQPNLAAAAEFAKRISNSTSKEDKSDTEKERSTHAQDRSNQRGRSSNKEDDSYREQGLNKLRTPDNKKLLDAKQLIDMIPKTKEELFSYEINWAIYDKYELHGRIRPWISKKITEFLGFEEVTLVDFIVSCTQKHVKASEVLESLADVLDLEAEMFVLKMWRMLIFEIKKVETGISVGSKN